MSLCTFALALPPQLVGAEAEAALADGMEAAEFLTMHVVQARLNEDTGNFQMAVGPYVTSRGMDVKDLYVCVGVQLGVMRFHRGVL